MRIYDDITSLIGGTPLLRLRKYSSLMGLSNPIIAKVESFNPGGSVKDRVAKAMLDDAYQRGLINEDTVIIEPTSGSTGIGLALIGALRGLRVIICMPDTMSVERRMLLKAYGAELVLTEGRLGMNGAIKKAQELSTLYPNSYIPSQFENLSNPGIHMSTTGPEIWNDTDGKIDILVAGVGTGGTLSGTGRYLKEKNPNIKVIAVEPEGSSVLMGKEPGAHKIQGIGAGFIPKTLDTSVYDEVIPIDDQECMKVGGLLARKEGLLVGISSGAAVAAATSLALREENKDKNIVVILPDTGERYLSTEMFS